MADYSTDKYFQQWCAEHSFFKDTILDTWYYSDTSEGIVIAAESSDAMYQIYVLSVDTYYGM